MGWPQAQDYQEAVQNPQQVFADPELQQAEVICNKLGLPAPYSGSAAVVYHLHMPDRKRHWAVKCFTRPVRDLQLRYRQISAHLDRLDLPFTVGFQYLEQGIYLSETWYPVLKMDWVEGQTFHQFLAERLEQTRLLQKLCPMWLGLAQRLVEARVIHGDLQHGNVLLVPGHKEGRVALKLVDYDGMGVPELAGLPMTEQGHEAYQHPQREQAKVVSPEMDRFSHLAIYGALRCLVVGGRGMWERYHDGNNLLFKKEDFRSPWESVLLRELWGSAKEELRSLAGRLVLAASSPLECVPSLENFVANEAVRSLTWAEGLQAGQLLDGPKNTGWQGTAVEAVPSFSQNVPHAETVTTAVRSSPSPVVDTGRLNEVLEDLAGEERDAALRAEKSPVEEGESEPDELPSRKAEAWSERTTKPSSGSGVLGLVHGLRKGKGWGKRLTRRQRKQVRKFLILGMSGLLLLAVLLLAVLLQGRGLFRARPPAPQEPVVASGSVQPPLPGGEKPERTVVPTGTRAGEMLTDNLGMKFAWIPPGSFVMGSPPGEVGRSGNEVPHRVTLTRGFWLGVYPVTQAQWQKVMKNNPSCFTGEDRPVERVSWDDCQEFCRKLSVREGKTYRLPTEAEWEYACRAGTTTAYCFGDDPALLNDYAWCISNSDRQTHPVGQKKANAWGLFDMHGNVWQWCQDRYGDYPGSDQVDPLGPVQGSDRVIRGGGWDDGGRHCRSAFRYGFIPEFRVNHRGFRLALVPSIVNPSLPQAEGPGTPDQKPSPPEPVVIPAPVNPPLPREDKPQLVVVPGGTRAGEVITNSLEMKLAWIPPGNFVMGSPPGEKGRGDDVPHRVTLTKGFWLGVYPVTQAQWQAVMKSNPSRFKGDDRPVEQVSWYDCQEFCRKLSVREGKTYRLPTEAEWEYACRAGTTTAYCFGDDPAQLGEYAWYRGNSNQKTHPVGQKKANAWGLYDMHGNVWQWCLDWYGDYPGSDQVDPQGPAWGPARVVRGGCWGLDPRSCRSAHRYWDVPGNRYFALGCRLALVPSGFASK
jgi:formylglycine-generating enzyme required for sulfatase activity